MTRRLRYQNPRKGTEANDGSYMAIRQCLGYVTKIPVRGLRHTQSYSGVLLPFTLRYQNPRKGTET